MTNKEKSRIQKEIVDSLEHKPHGRLLLAPRVGKTKLMIDIIKREKPESILWVTPSAELADVDIPKEFETWKAKRFVKKLTTVTWMSLHKMVGFFDMIILDEEQFATENNTVNLLNRSLDYVNIVSMTGTPTKHQDKIDIYKKLNLPILCDMSINQAVDVGILANYTIKVLEVNMSNEKNIIAGTKAKPFKTSEVAQYKWLTKIVQQAMYQKRKDTQFRILARMRAIKNSQSKLKATKELLNQLKGRILIFSGSIKQAEELCSYRYHSKTNDVDLKKFQSGEIDRIAMVNAGGTGFTYREIDHLVMVQADSDKNGLTSQKLARTLLQQKDYKATIWIVSLLDTQDEKWVESALGNFDKSKVEYIRHKNLNNNLNLNNELDMFKKHGVNEIKKGSKTYKI